MFAHQKSLPKTSMTFSEQKDRSAVHEAPRHKSLFGCWFLIRQMRPIISNENNTESKSESYLQPASSACRIQSLHSAGDFRLHLLTAALWLQVLAAQKQEELQPLLNLAGWWLHQFPTKMFKVKDEHKGQQLKVFHTPRTCVSGWTSPQ